MALQAQVSVLEDPGLWKSVGQSPQDGECRENYESRELARIWLFVPMGTFASIRVIRSRDPIKVHFALCPQRLFCIYSRQKIRR